MALESKKASSRKWPLRHLHDIDNQPIPFHKAQNLIWDSPERIVAMIAGSQGGKTSFGPWWLEREISMRGGGDYIAATASFDLFKLKMLPSMLACFESILKIGRYWSQDRVIELKDPKTTKFWATKSQDPMWGRIILRSADALGGLESATAKAAWLDECGQERFTNEAYRAIRRRLTIYRGRVLMTTTLYYIGWLMNNIIDPALATGQSELFVDQYGEIEYTVSHEKNTSVAQFDSTINPAFSIDEFDEQRRDMPDEDFQMFFRGRKATRRYLIYDNFAYDKHTIKPFPIPDSWRRYLGIDFGGAHTCGMFYAEEPGSGTLYAYREYLAGGRTIQEHVSNLLAGEPSIPLAYGGAGSEGEWRMNFTQAGLPVMAPSLKDVDLGINRVYAQHSINGIIYFRNLSGIIDEKGRYRRIRDKDNIITEDIENKNRFHYLDAERYIISEMRPGASLRAKVRRLGG